jgi:hypothetical protein
LINRSAKLIGKHGVQIGRRNLKRLQKLRLKRLFNRKPKHRLHRKLKHRLHRKLKHRLQLSIVGVFGLMLE